jgi:hypothetical protein
LYFMAWVSSPDILIDMTKMRGAISIGFVPPSQGASHKGCSIHCRLWWWWLHRRCTCPPWDTGCQDPPKF